VAALTAQAEQQQQQVGMRCSAVGLLMVHLLLTHTCT
jgi:hypothetical protein